MSQYINIYIWYINISMNKGNFERQSKNEIKTISLSYHYNYFKLLKILLYLVFNLN